MQQQIIWEIYKTRQKTKRKWLNRSYPNFEIFDMHPLILVHLRDFFFFFFYKRNSNYFLYNFFHKEGQGSDNLDVICKDKGYYLRRATYPKNCFCLGKTLLRYQATNSFYHLCDNRFCLAFTVWTHTNSTGCFKKRLHHCFIN